MRYRRIILILFNVALFLSVHAQSYSPQQIELAERLHSLANNAPSELAYIQTSKDIYETSEDLWFKVYLLDAQYLIPSLLSKTLYLQLLNESTKKAVWQEKYEIVNGFANGQVYLDNTLPEGNYILAAYTPNSFFGDTTEFYAVRRIKVVTDITTWKETLIIPVPDKVNSIQFTTFPEGGNLVSGIQSKLAFKAVNINGEPVDLKGTLFEDTTPIIEFKSIHAGMGSFIFTPDNSKKYFIRLSEPAIDSIFSLPEIYSSGMTMQLIKRDKESLSFKVSQRPERNEGDIYLRVQCRGEVYGMTTARLSKDLLIKVPLSGLPQGISEITLFNSSLEPIAERLVYVNMDRKLNITTELSKEIYQTRGKSTLKITVKDEKRQPVMANLGVSVFEKLYQNQCDSDNILSHVYLSSQLKGRIYNPSFYLNSNTKDRDEALDLLMLTQGWRRYVWNEMNLNKLKDKRDQVIFDGVKGEIYYPNMKRKILREHLFIMAFSQNKDSNKVLLPADSAGKFNLSTDHLKEWENDYVYLKPFGPYESQRQKKSWDPLSPPEFNFHIKLNDPFETINRVLKYNEIVYPLDGLKKEKTDSTDLYKTESGIIRIKEVTIKGKEVKTIRGKYLGSLDSIEMAKADDDYVCRYGVLNCPRHDRNEIGTTKPIQGFKYIVIYEYNTPSERVRKIVYWRPKYKESELLKLNNLTRVKAYYGPREFYQPNYDQDTIDAQIPDFRNTLLWEPSVITDEKGEATLSFYCSDINTDFVGRVEGVSGEGLLGTGYFKFTVRKLKPTP
jgi:hypothetical protein